MSIFSSVVNRLKIAFKSFENVKKILNGRHRVRHIDFSMIHNIPVFYRIYRMQPCFDCLSRLHPAAATGLEKRVSEKFKCGRAGKLPG